MNLLMMIHTSLFCFPVYTLAVSCSSHLNKPALLQQHMAQSRRQMRAVSSFNSVFVRMATALDVLASFDKQHRAEVNAVLELFDRHFQVSPPRLAGAVHPNSSCLRVIYGPPPSPLGAAARASDRRGGRWETVLSSGKRPSLGVKNWTLPFWVAGWLVDGLMNAGEFFAT